jgi:hypothetical protein
LHHIPILPEFATGCDLAQTLTFGEGTMRQTIGLLALLGLFSSNTLRADDTDDFLKAENFEGLLDHWKIEKNAIIGESKEPLKFNTFLCSKKKYKDFELKFQIRLKGGVGNSGVQVRSEIANPKTFAVKGPQCDVGAQYWGSLYGELFGGMMKASGKEVVEKVKKDDFNDYYIKVVGKKVTIKVNDVVAVDQEFEKLPDEGIIAFQLHAGPAMEATFKNIEFKNLSK